jgi:hypothetical protein
MEVLSTNLLLPFRFGVSAFLRALVSTATVRPSGTIYRRLSRKLRIGHGLRHRRFYSEPEASPSRVLTVRPRPRLLSPSRTALALAQLAPFVSEFPSDDRCLRVRVTEMN